MGRDVARTKKLRDIVAELGTVRLGEGPVMARLAEPLHELLGGEVLWTYRPVLGPTGWQLADVYGSALPRKHVEAFRRAIEHQVDDFAWYGPSRPDPAQRNRVIEALSAVRKKRPGYFETTRLYRESFLPMRLHEHHQLRVLLCEGRTLLAWFGLYQLEAPSAVQYQLMRALVPSLQRRLLHDRRLAEAQNASSALDCTLEQLGTATFIVGAKGRIEHANSEGRRRLDHTLLTAIHDAIAGRCTQTRVEVFPLQPRGYLVTVPEGIASDRLARRAAARWQLTARQTDVLLLLVRGHPNAVIAGELGISERAIELHVTALLEKAAVASRAALLAAVFTRMD